jgi:caffeoyl-CoA O-methyltransferase
MSESVTIPESYLRLISSPAPSYLNDLERETHLKIPKPQMLTGFSQGRFLSFLSKMTKPSRILEIGTFTGYGSLCLAEGLSKNGKLVTIESSEENVWLAQKYFRLSPFADLIDLRIGPGLELLPTLHEIWDLVYIDADKNNNLNYLETIWPNVKTDGIVLIDNIFARGAILKPEKVQKGFEKKVAETNRLLPNWKPDAEVTILPIRDGLTLIRKMELPILPNPGNLLGELTDKH